jgi:regulatory protein
MRTQLKGRRLLRQELEQRGIAKQAAKEASEGLDFDEEARAAVTAARKKWPHLKGELRERKQKLTIFLLRRGFPGPIAKRAVQEVSVSADHDEQGQLLDN